MASREDALWMVCLDRVPFEEKNEGKSLNGRGGFWTRKMWKAS